MKNPANTGSRSSEYEPVVLSRPLDFYPYQSHIEAPAVKNYSGLLIVPVFISFRPRLGQSRYA